MSVRVDNKVQVAEGTPPFEEESQFVWPWQAFPLVTVEDDDDMARRKRLQREAPGNSLVRERLP